MTNLKNEKRGGYYWIEGVPFPSVTAIIDILEKKSLRYWFGKQVYLAMVADPTMSEKEALSAPYKLSDKAKDRGQVIHSIVEAYKHTREYIEGIDLKYRGYAQAFYQWTADNHITITEHERTIVSKKFGFAGTMDLLVTLNGNTKPIVVDCKTGKDIYPEALLQLSAYRQGLREQGVETAGIAVLLLQESGAYKYQFCDKDYLEHFLACKTIWDWQNQEDILKMREYAKKAPQAEKGDDYGIKF